MTTAAAIERTVKSPHKTVSARVEDLEIHCDPLDLRRAAAIYQQYGAPVVRGVAKSHVAPILRDMQEILNQSVALLPQAKPHARHRNAWMTPDGAMFNDDPRRPGQKVVNTLRFNAMISGAFTQSLLNPQLLDVAQALIGPDIELWKWGQCVYKQPRSGVPKSLHQDEYYFQHKQNSTVGVLTYAIDTDATNGALQIVPGSHQLGVLDHSDDQHAGFALEDHWWQQSLLIPGKAGDAIFFHGLTIHGSEENRSERPRPVFIQRYRRADDFCIINVGSMTERREAEQHPRTSKGDDDWGLMVRGLRRYRPADNNAQ